MWENLTYGVPQFLIPVIADADTAFAAFFRPIVAWWQSIM
jgi:hypothetical protein